MIESFREFQAGPDPFGRNWRATFVWLQTAISIRHCDAIDVKFIVDDGEYKDEKVIALPHPKLLELSEKVKHPLNDAWVSKLAAHHLKKMIETGEDMEKPLVTMTSPDLAAAHAELEKNRYANV
ncbi:MAG: hypothetical protein U0Q16_27200 [Bryobacteraceae bacterium]